jgi:phosphomannomutase
MEVAGISPDQVLSNLATAHAREGKITTDDGLKIDLEDSWVHLRKSNTEPILRIIAEARTFDKAAALVESFRKEILHLSQSRGANPLPV